MAVSGGGGGKRMIAMQQQIIHERWRRLGAHSKRRTQLSLILLSLSAAAEWID
ncbi:hypothetical protein BDV36DRAFT_272357 [Aspergillus pseudocaelatus]|uniref:Uncharacterized protein n=2 Tax=Aspergillus subgen. Circumdati TaxID=2720871 RepID=A0ABQ6W535_9EURO|nr:hypothetical protein BDV36DRAFT_272357 [Aspergillus pseudocaelatus]